jgi:hypothetical protein
MLFAFEEANASVAVDLSAWLEDGGREMRQPARDAGLICLARGT